MVYLMRWWHQFVPRRTEGIGNFCCSIVSRECLSCESMTQLNPTGHLFLLQLNQCPASHRLSRGCPWKEMKPLTKLRDTIRTWNSHVMKRLIPNYIARWGYECSQYMQQWSMECLCAPSLQGTPSAPACFLLKVKWAEQAVRCQLIFLKP